MEQRSDVVVAKSVLLLVMLIVSGIFVALPIGVMRIRRVKEGSVTRRKFILALLNCFGGGAFIATGFLHLLPEVTEMNLAFNELLHGEQNYPFAYFVVCIGFLTILIIEHVVLSCVRSKPKVVLSDDPSCRCETIIRSGLPGVTASGLFSQSLITSRIKPHTICHSKTSPDLSQSVCDNVKDLMNESYSDTSNNHQEKIKIRETNNQLISYSGDKSYSQSQVMTVIERSTLHAFTVAVALSVHSVFEGLAFGLQDSINDAPFHTSQRALLQAIIKGVWPRKCMELHVVVSANV